MPTRMPAEWEPHERTLMCWPARDEIWGPWRDRADEDYATVANTIARFEPVTMIASPRHAATAAERCGPGVEVVELPIDDSWARDCGPIVVHDADGGRLALDWAFNAWGGKFEPHTDDDLLASRWAVSAGLAHERVTMVLEGGAICVDGEGTLLTTEQCLLHPNRNPDLTRARIESHLRTRLGVSEIVWLPFGLADDDDTDGHVDLVATFTRPGRVLLQRCDDPAAADHDRLSIDRRCLDGHLDAQGRPIEVVDLPVLPIVEIEARSGTDRIAVPYLNLYVCNGGVIVPTTGHPADADMLAIIGSEFPDREVVAVPGTILAIGGGGPHCITQQVPT